jgi:exodeoxyribonuclease V alpha subunit
MTGAAVPPGLELLAPFADAGVFGAGELQLCAAFARNIPGLEDEALLGLAVAARGPRLGHVCVDLGDAHRLIADEDGDLADALPWPGVEGWAATLARSPITADARHALAAPLRPLVLDGQRVYLQRYFADELLVADRLRERAARGPAAASGTGDALEAALDAVVGPDDPSAPDLQRQAARVALSGNLAVIAGGPGTGKTRTVASLLAAALEVADRRGERLRIALAAPTGKAASRMTEAVHLALAGDGVGGTLGPAVATALADQPALTLHRLLGARPGGSFRHGPENPLAYDLVVVDETSMVSLPLMATLLGALRPGARLVLVGDPFQLTSIEAGSVLADVVAAGTGGSMGADTGAGPLAGRVTVLDRSYRFGAESDIAALAGAVRAGDAARALDLLSDPERRGVTWIDGSDDALVALVDEVIAAGAAVVEAARDDEVARGLAAMRQVKVLAATRQGPAGMLAWGRRIEDALADRVPGLRTGTRWYVGRPVMVTANDHPNRLDNGDTGLVVRQGDGVAVAFPGAAGPRFVPTSKLDRVETWWAMTIHKSQGSEFPHVVVSLPAATSPILSRELLYTAVTRASERVTVVASRAALVAAIGRPVMRASGLRERLQA